MSGSIKTRSMGKGNKAVRGDTSAAPDNLKYLRIEEERGHEACALSYNIMMMQILASLSSHPSIEQGQNQSGSVSSEWPGSGHMMSNKARMMQTTASSMFDDYRARNGPGTSGTLSSDPTTSNNARMVQMIAPSSL